MRRARRAPWLAALTLACSGVATPALANHTTFSGSVDRFEIDGNAFGPADGVPDQVDEFDDGTIAPNWQTLLGTAIESGGVLTLRDPGVDIALVPGVTLDISNVENTVDVANGAGDFTATSYWVPTPLGTNREIHFQLYALGVAGIESAGLTVQNLDAATAGPNPVGYSVTQSVTFIVGSGVPQVDTVAINPADITGRIVLRMAFDDATDTMVCSFSLDGGLTFLTPFPPLHVFQLLDELEVILGAASIASTIGPPPPTVLQYPVATKLLLVKNPSGPAFRRVTYQVKDGPNGAFLAGSPPNAGATFNLKVGGATQCFRLPASGWKFSGGGYSYLDATGAHGPVRSVKVRRTGNGTFQSKVLVLGRLGTIDIVPPNASLPGDMNLHLNGPTAVEYCGSTTGGAVTANDVKTFKVKYAPAPGACTLAACSPSGAFLDGTAAGS
jgi:hypothetical protein